MFSSPRRRFGDPFPPLLGTRSGHSRIHATRAPGRLTWPGGGCQWRPNYAASGPHSSIQRNPLIAEAFHRTGAVEIWGRGTNRVIEECERYGIDPPTFEEHAGALYVTFRALIGPTPQVTPQVVAILMAAESPRSRSELQETAGLKDREHFRRAYLEPLLAADWLEMTIPDKPRSSKQRYRTTVAGTRALDQREPR